MTSSRLSRRAMTGFALDDHAWGAERLTLSSMSQPASSNRRAKVASYAVTIAIFCHGAVPLVPGPCLPVMPSGQWSGRSCLASLIARVPLMSSNLRLGSPSVGLSTNSKRAVVMHTASVSSDDRHEVIEVFSMRDEVDLRSIDDEERTVRVVKKNAARTPRSPSCNVVSLEPCGPRGSGASARLEHVGAGLRR